MDKPGGTNSYVSISVDSLIDNTQAHFDAYAVIDSPTPTPDSSNANDQMLLYAKAPYTWTLRELTELTRIGVTKLFIPEEQKEKYTRYLKSHREVPKVDESLEAKFRIKQVQDIGVHVIEGIFLNEIDKRHIKQVENIAVNLVDCLLEDKRSVLQIEALADHDLYTYIHSIGVASISTAMAINMGEQSPDVLKIFAMGGLLHDIGKKEIPLNVLNKAGPLDDKEWGMMKRHPTSGFELLKEMEVEKDILDMVSLHHEKIDGSGYPYGLSGRQIPEKVCLVTIADIFNALTTTRCYHRKRSRFEALMFMKHHLSGKISAEIFKALVSSLVEEGEEEEKACSPS